MKVLLLGATGLLGHNVLRRLLAEGHQVVALVRSPEGIRLREGSWETVVGSILDYDILRQSAQGCQAVVNCAGTTDMTLLRREDFLPANVELCRLLVRLLDELEISVLVHTSTVNTIGFGTAACPGDESMPMCPPFEGTFYADSKREGERIVLSAAKEGRHVVVVNPGFMLGAWDAKPSSGRMLLAAYRKPLMFAPKGGKAFVHVDDVARMEVAALTRGTNGTRYIAANSHACLRIKELYRMQAAVCGYKQCVVEVPDWLLLAVGGVGDMLRRMGVRTQVSTANIRQLLVREHYSSALAEKELGAYFSPVEEAISAFHEWRQQQQ